MEPRGCLAEYDPRDDRYTLRCTVQGPHHGPPHPGAARSSSVPETKFRVISDNVGGGFGMKGGALSGISARRARRAAHRPAGEMDVGAQRGASSPTSTAATTSPRPSSRSTRTASSSPSACAHYANIGAYHASDRSAGPPTNNLGVLAGTYTIPAIHVEVNGTFTNTMLTGPYRGAGRPEAAYVLETLVDLAARKLGIDPAELRRRNTIPADAMPYKTALVYTYDCGDFGKNLDDCLAHGRLCRASPRAAGVARSSGKLRGIGISNTVEASNAGLIEHAEMRFDPTGTLTVAMGTHDHGQGHATTFRQIIADKLGIAARPRPLPVRRHRPGRDRHRHLRLALDGRAAAPRMLIAADKIIAKGKKIAAHMLEAAEHDIVFEQRQVHRRRHRQADRPRRGRAATPSTRARCRQGMEPGLFETGTFDGGERTFPNGCHIGEVEIDEETGAVELVRYHRGRRRRPHDQSAAGRGPAARRHRAGRRPGADGEHRLRRSGQLVTGSFMDYGMPRADDFCDFALGENEVPTKTNPLGVKGAGESGTVGALPAVMNAVNDALARDRRALRADAGDRREGVAGDTEAERGGRV